MGGKKGQVAADDKKKIKELKKTAEDKTFGMKNKNKSKAVQKVIKGLATQQVKGGMDLIINSQYAEKKAKAEAEKERQFLAEIKLGDHRAMDQTQKEADPAKKVCPYFKAGLCQKGRKCKFSHEKDGGNQSTKANVYQDIRGEGADDEGLFSDQKKLEEAVNFNEKKYANPNATNLPCHHFLNAIADKKYGWFWQCPNGYDCKYKHALPVGFVLQTKDDKAVEKKEFNVERDIDDAMEDVRNKGTKITYEVYMEWRERRKKRKAAEAEAKKKDELKKAGIKQPKKGIKIMTGKSLFVFDPTLFQDDEDASDNKDFKLEVNAEENAEELNKGGKKWEAKVKVDVIEEDLQGEDKQDDTKTDKNKDAGTEKTEEPQNTEKVEVDEELFDEEELPDDID